MLDSFQYDVFLSHSAKDKAVVRQLAERLPAAVRQHLKVWVDEWEIPVAASRQSAATSSGKQQTSEEKDGGALPRRRYAGKIEEGLEHSNFGFRISNFGFAKPGISAHAFGSDWAQLLSHSQPSTLNPQPSAAPVNSAFAPGLRPDRQGRRFVPLRLDDAPIKGSLAQFLYINWLPANREQEHAGLLEACSQSEAWPISDNALWE